MRPNFSFKINLLILLSFCIIHSTLCIATVRYVSKTGLSIPPYITWETAANSIQECINVCVFGDTIYVANGVYEEQVVMIPGLTLLGAGTDSCIVDCRNFPPQGLHAVEIADSGLIKGFYIRTSNNFDYGYGIYTIGVTGLITGNKFSNANTGIYLYDTKIIAYNNYFFNVRRGVTAANSNSIVRKNDIFQTTQSGVAGIFITAFNNYYQPIIDSNYIVANTPAEGIRKSFGARPNLKNNTIILINSPAGMYLSTTDSLYVYNNVIVAEAGALGIYNSGVQYLRLYNNYITGNLGDAITIGAYDIAKNNVVTKTNKGIIGNVNSIIQYNNVWNNNINYSGFTPDSTNISVDPMVVNDDTTQGKLDFHLQKYSPLIDAGDPTILDKDGTRSDIGLYGGPYGESYFYVDLPPRIPVNLTAEVDSNIVTLRWNKNTEADFGYYNLFYDTTKNFPADSTKLINSQPDTFYYFVIPPETDSLYFKLTAVDNQGNESNPSEEVGVVITSVKDEWKPLNNYVLYQNYPNLYWFSGKWNFRLNK